MLNDVSEHFHENFLIVFEFRILLSLLLFDDLLHTAVEMRTCPRGNQMIDHIHGLNCLKLDTIIVRQPKFPNSSGWLLGRKFHTHTGGNAYFHLISMLAMRCYSVISIRLESI